MIKEKIELSPSSQSETESEQSLEEILSGESSFPSEDYKENKERFYRRQSTVKRSPTFENKLAVRKYSEDVLKIKGLMRQDTSKDRQVSVNQKQESEALQRTDSSYSLGTTVVKEGRKPKISHTIM